MLQTAKLPALIEHAVQTFFQTDPVRIFVVVWKAS